MTGPHDRLTGRARCDTFAPQDTPQETNMTLSRRTTSIAIASVSAFFGACGGSDTAGTPQAPQNGSAVDRPGTGLDGSDALAPGAGVGDTAVDAAVFVGVDESEAEVLASERGLTLRVMSRDGEQFVGTADYRDDRVNLDVVDAMVVAAWRG
jgi:hypothetical protein